MNKTVVIYGSSTGTCQAIAEKLAARLNATAIDVQNLDDGLIEENTNLIIGTSTWGDGELQDDWYAGLKLLQSADLKGKTIALFGCGDSVSYSDTFVSALGVLYNGLKDSGAVFVGRVPVDGYDFTGSEAVVDGEFVGLPLDEVNEDDKTDERIDSWLESIKDKL